MNNSSDTVQCASRQDQLLHGWLESGWASLSQDYLILEMNHSFAAWLGLKPAEALGQSLLSLAQKEFPSFQEAFHPAETPPLSAFTQRLIASTTLSPPQWFDLEVLRHPAGFFVRLNSALPPTSNLAEETWDEYLKSEPARRELFVRLLRAEAQLDSLVHRWPGVIFSQRADFSFQFVSPKILALTGVEPAGWKKNPQRFWQVVHEADAEELKQQIRASISTPKGVTSTYRIRHLVTGKVAYIMEHRQAIATKGGLVLGYEGIWLDVTRQTIAERRLSTAAWKETLALLTMGLAHDFSNVMAGIHSLSESFLAQLDPSHPFHEGLDLIKQNSLQASQLVHRIINLHHGKTGERNYYNLNEILADIIDLVRKILPRRIEVKVECAPHSLPLYVDAVEFRQVIINLILNAADAMPGGGQLIFRTSLHPQLPLLRHAQGIPPRVPAVCLDVHDAGCGIKPAHLPLLFDPFFTTKSVNKGSGLGLYNARLFVEKHYGSISVDSTEGRGTCVSIWLPQCDFTEAERAHDTVELRRQSLLLLGDAGDSMLGMAELLRSNGYHVVTAFSAPNASEIIASRDYPLAGILALSNGADAEIETAFETARAQQPPLYTILQILGRNQDELESPLLSKTDLVISPDMSQNTMVNNLRDLLGQAAPGTL